MSKKTSPAFIIGAGLTGLIAAHAWPTARILEKEAEPPKAHRALLRFRSDAVARLTGVEFRKVRVRKGIYYRGAFHQPDISLANMYSQKVLGGRIEGDRSIWNIDAVDRFVAPETLHEQLLEAVADRLTLGTDIAKHPTNFGSNGPVFVSTIPLPVMIGEVVNDYDPGLEFERTPITVTRFDVPGADVFQTIYFPDEDTSIYRASMTGRMLIIEAVADEGVPPGVNPLELSEVINAFGIQGGLIPIDNVEQRYGKIAPIDDAVRRELLFRLTQDYKIYSLGRFAIWKNILLDDVVQDIDVVKRLMKSGAAYDHRRAA